jgi:type III restriction enzyme
MSRTTINRLIINSPYEEPQRHWRYDRQTRTFELVAGRRPAGYVVASGDSRAFDDPGIFVEIPLVNRIRPRVKAWREAGYPGVTSITKRLLEEEAANPCRLDGTGIDRARGDRGRSGRRRPGTSSCAHP